MIGTLRVKKNKISVLICIKVENCFTGWFKGISASNKYIPPAIRDSSITIADWSVA